MSKVYFPPLRSIYSALGLDAGTVASSSKVSISTALLRRLLETSVNDLTIDETAYIADHPDLKQEFDKSRLDPTGHFREVGYFEGRLMPLDFDEAYYLSTNPDVKRAVDSGEIKDPRDHFINVGVYEGRSPSLKAEF